ncbi:DUF4238 domain-containing protein [Vibrio coralliirubri]|uniref:DUF4238 domain-containing protein n=1 Tax=Vibrio coralliirubri TaxID=1516159 RepID=UPI0022838531|nr:DUF4238 domain-containing protein [Vibrio coralliirubri]MCY9865092.1 DUF4238 domain-containing protein [Vibrio coralliirubri]
MTEPRKHHYISQCYLRNFTLNKNIYVLDGKLRKSFSTNTGNVCSLRDFNTIYENGERVQTLENAQSQFEDVAAKAISKVINGEEFSGSVRDTLLELMAMFHVRNPVQRNKYREIEEIGGGLGLLATDVDETYIRAELELSMIGVVKTSLSQRGWKVVKAAEGAGEFVTSEFPLSINFKDISSEDSSYIPPLNGINTRVFFPLTSNIGLLGVHGVDNCVVEAGMSEIAYFNRLTIARSDRIYIRDIDNCNIFLEGANPTPVNCLITNITHQ